MGAGALVASLPVACLVTAILVVNNLRDIDTDRATGKRTFMWFMEQRTLRRERAKGRITGVPLSLRRVPASAPGKRA